MPETILRPDWFDKLNWELRQDRLVMNRYFIHQASLFASPALNLKELARKIGVSEVMLSYPYSTQPDRGVISRNLAVKLQDLCGKDRLPAKLLRPDLSF